MKVGDKIYFKSDIGDEIYFKSEIEGSYIHGHILETPEKMRKKGMWRVGDDYTKTFERHHADIMEPEHYERNKRDGERRTREYEYDKAHEPLKKSLLDPERRETQLKELLRLSVAYEDGRIMPFFIGGPRLVSSTSDATIPVSIRKLIDICDEADHNIKLTNTGKVSVAMIAFFKAFHPQLFEEAVKFVETKHPGLKGLLP